MCDSRKYTFGEKLVAIATYELRGTKWQTRRPRESGKSADFKFLLWWYQATLDKTYVIVECIGHLSIDWYLTYIEIGGSIFRYSDRSFVRLRHGAPPPLPPSGSPPGSPPPGSGYRQSRYDRADSVTSDGESSGFRWRSVAPGRTVECRPSGYIATSRQWTKWHEAPPPVQRSNDTASDRATVSVWSEYWWSLAPITTAGKMVGKLELRVAAENRISVFHSWWGNRYKTKIESALKSLVTIGANN